MKPKAVIFDVGGVLLESPFLAALRWAGDWDIPLDALRKIFGEYSRTVASGQEPPMWHEVECGRVELSEFVAQMHLTLDTELPPGHKARTLTARDFNPFANGEPVAVMIQLSDEIRAQGLKTGILTNNVREWGHWRERIPIESFDVVVDSCEVGMRKPDPEIYLLMCESLRLAANDCLFLDDHPANVEAALAVGLDALLVTDDFDAAASEVRARF
ncbi:MAG: HAD family phosphatase [Acidimicrobiales bacterium]|nr:HAD family phosphatase [Acidimicrobiales bacterium]